VRVECDPSSFAAFARSNRSRTLRATTRSPAPTRRPTLAARITSPPSPPPHIPVNHRRFNARGDPFFFHTRSRSHRHQPTAADHPTSHFAPSAVNSASTSTRSRGPASYKIQSFPRPQLLYSLLIDPRDFQFQPTDLDLSVLLANSPAIVSAWTSTPKLYPHSSTGSFRFVALLLRPFRRRTHNPRPRSERSFHCDSHCGGMNRV